METGISKTRVVVTGGAGFIGHHLVEHVLKNTDWDIVVLDKLTYASSGLDRLRDINCFDTNRVTLFTIDLASPLSVGIMREIGEVDYIFNLASESHVDNSISDPVPFVQNNINLTLHMLEWARGLKNLKKFVQFSTDEVYGTAPDGVDYTEGDRFNAGNPYSASKAAQETLCSAYANTYKIPIIITNTMNVIGERQHQEKFIPMIIESVLNGKTMKIHSNKEKTKAGSRFYVHARNVSDALLWILLNTDESLDNIDAHKGKWNIVGEQEMDNLEMAQLIADYMGEELKYEMVDFHSTRPGHDLRYALNGGKLKEQGYSFPKSFEESIEKTIEWTLQNKKWL